MKEEELGERVMSTVSRKRMFENCTESNISCVQGMALLE